MKKELIIMSVNDFIKTYTDQHLNKQQQQLSSEFNKHQLITNNKKVIMRLDKQHKPPFILPKDDDGWTPLHDAARQGNIDVIMILLKAEVDINTTITDGPFKGHTSLHFATGLGYINIVKALIKAGAKVNITSGDGWTPLYWALVNGHVTVVNILLKAGAKISPKNNTIQTFININLGNQKQVLFEALDKHPLTSKDRALFTKHIEDNPILVFSKNECGNTPLHIAARHGHSDIIKALEKANANMMAKNGKGNTPLQEATIHGKIKAVECLK